MWGWGAIPTWLSIIFLYETKCMNSEGLTASHSIARIRRNLKYCPHFTSPIYNGVWRNNMGPLHGNKHQ